MKVNSCEMCVVLLLLSGLLMCSQGSVCISTEKIQKPVCGNTSRWAFGTNFTATHDFIPIRGPSYNIAYNMGSSFLCNFQYLSFGSCKPLSGENCKDCTNNYTIDGSIVAVVSVTKPDLTNNVSDLTYSLPGLTNQLIHQFTFAECPQDIGNASMSVNSNPCGYHCTGRLSCKTGFHLNPAIDFNRTYLCSVIAEWDPKVPLESCIPDSEPTTTETATTPTTSTTSASTSTQGEVAYFTNSGPSLAGIGGVLVAVCIVLIVYMAINNTPNNVVLYVMSALCICVWAIALGLCFGMSTNKSAVIAGIVLGSLAVAGMVVVIVFLILHIKSHKN